MFVMSESGGKSEESCVSSAIVVESLDRTQPTRYARIYHPDNAWLARADVEPPLEPDLAIIDSHHHLWDIPGYPYLMPEFAAELNCGHQVVATVFNECHSMYRTRGPEHMRPVGEVEFCAGIAAMSDSGRYGPTRVCAGIVGAADLLQVEHLAEVVEAQLAVGGGRFRGVRYRGSWDADPEINGGNGRPGLYLEPAVQESARRLATYGLSLDAHLVHPQLPDLAQLARACPETSIVLCHTGIPLGYGSYAGRRDEVFAQWKAGISAVAACPNVTVKLGGLMVRRSEYDFARSERPITSAALAHLWEPYFMTCIEMFGPQRCMVESNFPVDKVGIGYAALWNSFKRILASLSMQEKNAVFHGTASRVYKLNLG